MRFMWFSVGLVPYPVHPHRAQVVTSISSEGDVHQTTVRDPALCRVVVAASTGDLSRVASMDGTY